MEDGKLNRWLFREPDREIDRQALNQQLKAVSEPRGWVIVRVRRIGRELPEPVIEVIVDPSTIDDLQGLSNTVHAALTYAAETSAGGGWQP